MRLLTIILTIVFVQPTVGQVVNSISGDKSGMYYYSLDSLTKIIKDLKKTEKLILTGDLEVVNIFPDKLNELQVLKDNGKLKIKNKHIKSTDILIEIKGLSIIRDEVTIAIYTLEKDGKYLKFWGDGVYTFYFKYLPDTRTYKLNQIKSGLVE